MTGLFETMLAMRGRIVQCEEHFARLASSARALQLGVPDAHEFRSVAEAVVRSDDELAVRVTYSNGQLTAIAGPIPAITLRRRRGARVSTLPRDVQREQPQHKWLSYITARPQIPPDVEEALFVDAQGHVLEGTTTNVFAMKNDALITAGEQVLPGIVRAWVLTHAPRVILRPPTLEELRAGSFLTSSLTLLAPITSIDGRTCNAPGAMFEELREHWNAGVLAG